MNTEAQPQHSEQQQEWELISDSPDDFCSIIRETKTKRTIACNVQGASGTLIAGAHNAALAAERQRREQEVYETPPSKDCPTGIKWSDVAKWNGLACEENQKLLLSAQAAIEKVISYCRRHGEELRRLACPAEARIYEDIQKQLQNFDLSALREHDAEVRKQLVDALARITEWSVATQNERYKLEMKWFGNPVCDAPNRIAADALAKVKEASEAQPYCPSTRFGSGT